MICNDTGSGGIDIVAILEHPPVITNVQFLPSKFVGACRPATVAVTAFESDGEQLSYRWSVTQTPNTDARYNLRTRENVARFSADEEGMYQLRVDVTDSAGLQAAMTFPVHISAGLGNDCQNAPFRFDVNENVQPAFSALVDEAGNTTR